MIKITYIHNDKNYQFLLKDIISQIKSQSKFLKPINNSADIWYHRAIDILKIIDLADNNIIKLDSFVTNYTLKNLIKLYLKNKNNILYDYLMVIPEMKK